MADKRPWLGSHTFPVIWIWICVLLNIGSVLSLVMLIISEFVILVNNFNTYVDTYGHSYPPKGYIGESTCGFVENTNIPKHYGSAIWSLFAQLSIIVLITLAIASDLAWRVSSYNVWGGRWVSAFFAVGIMAGEHNKGLFYYVIANGFYKLFIVVLYESQSFKGLSGSSSSTTIYNTYPTGTTSTSVGVGVGVGVSTTTNTDWRRDWGPTISNNHSWSDTSGTELWAFWCGIIVLISIVPSIVASIFLTPWAAAQAASATPAPSRDPERGKTSEPPKQPESRSAPAPGTSAPGAPSSTSSTKDRERREQRPRPTQPPT